MKIALSVILLIIPSVAVADINIYPFFTKNIKVSNDYYGNLSYHIKNIISTSGGEDCSGLSVNLYTPQPIPEQYSPDGIVTWNSERNTLLNYTTKNDGNVVFVAALSACGDYQDYAAIGGCAGPNQAVTIEISGNAREDAIKLVHEIGHSFYLAWNNPSSDVRRSFIKDGVNTIDESHLADDTKLMYYRVTSNTKMSNYECTAFSKSNNHFKSPISASIVLAQNDLDAENNVVVGSANDLTQSLEFIISQKWLHEPPIADLKTAIDAEGLDYVRSNIVSNEHPELWRNSLITIGYFGSEADIELARYFLSRPVPVAEGNERLVSDAKAAASEAIGILTGRFLSVAGASVAVGIIDSAVEAVAEVSAVESTPLPIEEINLDGLSAEEQLFAQRRILKNLAVVQQNAIVNFDDSALLELARENEYASAIVVERRFSSEAGNPSNAVSSNALEAIGLDQNFINGLQSIQ